jgi:F-type H+-transporting ATPase subunit b
MKKLFTPAKISLLYVIVLIFLASTAFASGGGEGVQDSKKWFDFAWKTFDFIVLVGFLYWLLAAKIKEFFVGRRKDIKESLEKSAQQKTEAQEKFKEYSEKIDKASAEIDGIIEMIKSQGVAEKQKIIDDAEKVANKMKEDAQARIEQEFKKAADQLRMEAVLLSTQMAEEILKRNITAQDNETIVREYMDKVVNKH